MATYLGPLTTEFVPPSSCYDLTVSSSVYEDYEVSTITDSAGSESETTVTVTVSDEYLQLFDYGLDGDCYPTGSPNKSIQYDAYYSPGLCPENWFSARQSISAGDTVVDCCPTGFEIGSVLCLTSTSGGAASAVLFLNGERQDAEPTLTSVSSQTIYATGIEVRYREGDFDGTSLSSAPTSEGTAIEESGKNDNSDGASSSSSAAPLPTNDSAENDGGGMSTGAKIGIGVGVPVAVLLIAAIAFIIFWRKRKAKAAVGPVGPAAGPGNSPQFHSAGQAYPVDPNNQYAGMSQTYPADPSKQFVTAGAAPVGAAGHYNHEAKASEMYAPGANGPNQNQQALSEMGGTPVTYTYGSPSPHSAGVSPSSPPAQPAYAGQTSYVGGPVPGPAELYPETIEDNRRAS